MPQRIHVCCEHCHTTLTVPEGSEGKHVRCPKCAQLFVIHEPQSKKAAPDEPIRKARRVSETSPQKSTTSTAKKKPAQSAPVNDPITAPAWDTAYAPVEDIRLPDRKLPPRQKQQSSKPQADNQYDVAGHRGRVQNVGNAILKDIQLGGRYVRFSYAISLIRITFQCHSGAIYIAPGKSARLRSTPYTLITLLLGWWGIPWGPIYSIGAIATNLQGGVDITDDVIRMASHGASDDRGGRFWN